jgi:hypothetical protein
LIACVVAFALAVGLLPRAPFLDGDIREFASPTFAIAKPDTSVRVWVARHGESLYVAADLPDTSYYWGDDFVVSLDADGSGGEAPGDGDRQWYLRRDVDSSVVATASGGRWNFPAPLGAVRRGKDWEVASRSTARGWSVELRLSAPFGERRRIAFRTYDSAPQGWWSWPAPPESTRATVVERRPNLWEPLHEKSAR